MIISPLLQDFGNPQIMHAMQMDDLIYNCFKHMEKHRKSERQKTFQYDRSVHMGTTCEHLMFSDPMIIPWNSTNLPTKHHRYHLYTTKLDNSGVLFFFQVRQVRSKVGKKHIFRCFSLHLEIL